VTARFAVRTIAGALAVTLAAACSSSQEEPPRATMARQDTPLVTPRFRDVTQAAGLAHVVQGSRRREPNCLLGEARVNAVLPDAPLRVNSNFPREQCVPERMSGGAAAGDFDGDGWIDLYLTRLDAPGALMHNDGDGTFTDVTQDSGLDALDEPSNGAAWVDVDLDGHLDLFVTTIAGSRFALFHNDANGRFTDEAVARGVAARDGTVHVDFSVNVGDIDRDGWPDLSTTEWRITQFGTDVATSHNRLFRNRGDAAPGVFDDVTVAWGVQPASPAIPYWGFASQIADFDRDGNSDLVLVNDFGGSRLFWGDGERFDEATYDAGVGTDENGMGLTSGDYDGDGDFDLFVSSIFDADAACRDGVCGRGTTGNRLYRNDGKRTFEDVTTRAGVREGGWGWGAAFFDATNSGRLDLVHASGVDFPWESTAKQYGDGPMFFWRNVGDGTFAPVTRDIGLATARLGKGLVVLDYDRDGRLDVLVVRDGDAPVLLHNETPGERPWLVVRAEGRAGQPVLGAVVTVEERGRRQVGLVDSVTHYLGQGPPDPHFGFGVVDATIDKVTVEWPGRPEATVLRNVRPNDTLVVSEPGRP
jgi:enediyne biosynthesis protein E4